MSGMKGRSGRKKIEGLTRSRSGRIVYHGKTDACSCGRPKLKLSKQCKRCRSAWSIEYAACANCGRLFVRSSRKKATETCSYACGKALRSARQAALLVANGTSRLRTFICAWCHRTVTRPVRPVRDAGVCCSRPCGFAYRDAKRRAAKQARLKRITEDRCFGRRCRVCGVAVPARKLLCDGCRHKASEKSRNKSRECRAIRAGKKRPRTCPVCGLSFQPTYGDKRRTFCSRDCSRHANKLRKYIPAGIGIIPDEWAQTLSVFRALNVAVQRRCNASEEEGERHNRGDRL
jgi:hypothetical protein